MRTSHDRVLTYVIASNRLASTYLVSVLKHRGSQLVVREMPPTPSEELAVFVLNDPFESMPLSQGLVRLRSAFPRARFVVVDHEQSDSDVINLLTLGLHGFVAFSNVVKHLQRAVQSVAAGGLWVSSAVLQAYVEHHNRGFEGRPRSASETTR